jgi:hypothetical protein
MEDAPALLIYSAVETAGPCRAPGLLCSHVVLLTDLLRVPHSSVFEGCGF